jgi:wingless-type MMTV integration site family protein 8
VTGINDNASPSKSRLEQEMANLPVTRLAFTEDAADYCAMSNGTSTGSPATVGRICSRRKGPGVTSDERRSCRNLCKACGLKVKKQRKKITTTCNCKFHWCCQVHCSTCEKEETTFTCSL